MGLSSHFANQLVDYVTGREMFVSLHTAEPGDAGAHEVQTARKSTSKLFGKGAVGATASQREVMFEELPAAEITHVGLWDSERGGKFLAGAALPKKKSVDQGDALRFGTAKLALQIK